MTFEPTPAMVEDTLEGLPDEAINTDADEAIRAFVEHLATNPESMRAVADYCMDSRGHDWDRGNGDVGEYKSWTLRDELSDIFSNGEGEPKYQGLIDDLNYSARLDGHS